MKRAGGRGDNGCGPQRCAVAMRQSNHVRATAGADGMQNARVRGAQIWPVKRVAERAWATGERVSKVWARSMCSSEWRWPTPFGGALAFLTMLLLTHPYGGIEADGILYTIQALYKIDPQPYRHDLFFEFGSQTDLSLFAAVFGKAVATFGVIPSYRFGLIVAQLVWWTAAYRISRKVVGAPWHWLVLTLAAGMPALYASHQLAYAEKFLSARLPAEAIALWAIVFSLERRLFAAFAAAALASALHPLMGAVGLAVVAFCAAPRVPWWRILAVGLALFGLVQMLPIHALLVHPFDSEWLALARYDIGGLFPSIWGTFPWNTSCWALALPILLSAVEPGARGRFWDLLALIGVAGMAVSVVADIAGSDALWVQLQTWRVLWILTFMQWPALGVLARRLRGDASVLLWLLAIFWLMMGTVGGFAALALAVGVKVVSLARSQPFSGASWTVPTPMRSRALFVATVLAAVAFVKFELAYQAAVNFYFQPYRTVNFLWLEALSHTNLAIVTVLTLIGCQLIRGRAGQLIFGIVLTGLLGYAIVNFDQRSPDAKIVESRCDDRGALPFAGVVRPGQVVYWDGPAQRLVYTWFLLRTANYFSPWQAAGSIFHRETLFDALRKSALVTGRPNAGRPEDDHVPYNRILTTPKVHRFLNADGVRRVCADPILDFLVSPRILPGIPFINAWQPVEGEKYWLIDCRAIRQEPTAS